MNYTIEYIKDLDQEWIELMIEAKSLGLKREDISEFFESKEIIEKNEE